MSMEINGQLRGLQRELSRQDKQIKSLNTKMMLVSIGFSVIALNLFLLTLEFWWHLP